MGQWLLLNPDTMKFCWGTTISSLKHRDARCHRPVEIKPIRSTTHAIFRRCSRQFLRKLSRHSSPAKYYHNSRPTMPCDRAVKCQYNSKIIFRRPARSLHISILTYTSVMFAFRKCFYYQYYCHKHFGFWTTRYFATNPTAISAMHHATIRMSIKSSWSLHKHTPCPHTTPG